MTAANWVTLVSLVAGAICFFFYCWGAVAALSAKAAATATTSQAKAIMNPDAKTVSIDDFTKLLEAIGKLTDSLSKASPSLTSLIGAVLMFAIAAVASGAITGSPGDASHKTQQSGGPSGNSQAPAPGNSSAHGT